MLQESRLKEHQLIHRDEIKLVKIIQCKNHRKLKFSIPENIEECFLLNSFQEIKSLEFHLENNPNCKLIEWSDSN